MNLYFINIHLHIYSFEIPLYVTIYQALWWIMLITNDALLLQEEEIMEHSLVPLPQRRIS